MSGPCDEFEADALELRPPEPDGADTDPAGVEHAWEEEIRRRIDEYRSGAVKAVPASEVFAKARARLR